MDDPTQPDATAPRRPRGAEARASYLRAAVSLAEEQLANDTVASMVASTVPIAEVGTALGRSRTNLYHHWDSRDAFWRDLVVFLVRGVEATRGWDLSWWTKEPNPSPMPDPEVQQDLELARTTTDPTHQTRLVANGIERALRGDPTLLLSNALHAYRPMPEAAAFQQRRHEHLRAEVAERLRYALVIHERRLCDPLELADLATLVLALLEGNSMAGWNGDPTGLAVVDGAEWTSSALAVQCLLEGATTPGTPPGPDPSLPLPTPEEAVPEPPWTDAQREQLTVAAQLFVDTMTGAPALDDDGHHDGDEVRALSAITVSAVARAAGVNRRTVYRFWATNSDLRLELLTTLLDVEVLATAGRARRALQRPRVGAAALGAVLEAITPLGDQQHRTSELVRAFLSQSSNAAVRDRFDEAVAELVSQVAAALAEHDAAHGRTLRPGISHVHLARLVLAISWGVARMGRTSPTFVRRLQHPDATCRTAVGACLGAIDRAAHVDHDQG